MDHFATVVAELETTHHPSLPNSCGNSLLQIACRYLHDEGIMANMSRRCQDQKNFPPVQVTGIVKVSRQEEKDLSRQMYWTEIVDVSAQTKDGAKLFESFHVMTVPEGQFEKFETMRKQVRESLASEFVRAFQRLCEEGYPNRSTS